MKRDLGLRILSQIMGWDGEQDIDSIKEFDWVLFMSKYKYDGYRDYLAGARFLESLCKWLLQFEQSDREIAYNFVKDKLIYFSLEEIERLIEKFFPDYVQKDLISDVSEKKNIKKYQIWSSEESIEEYNWQKRKTLFMGLSEGARLGLLRRGNSNILSNEQIVITAQADENKWDSLLKDLRKDLQKIREEDISSEKFSRVYLLDDFTASGTSLIRNPEGSEVKGKLIKFAQSLKSAETSLDASFFEEDYSVVVHHYIGTEQAKDKISSVYEKERGLFESYGIKDIKFTFGLLLSSDIKFGIHDSHEFVALCKKYYNNIIEGNGEHGGQSGTSEKMFGYANCGLPVVLEHNTPNNSLPLLWADTVAFDSKPKMTPLFRRRERHSDLKRFKEI